MTASTPAWSKVLGAVLAAEFLLIAAAFLWVAIYSHLIAPGQPIEAYRAHAQLSSPWVSLIVGIPLFYLLGRWLGSLRSAVLLFGLYLALDLAVLAALAPAGPLPLGFMAASYATKLASLLVGARAR